jgi:hypothetical protein
MGFFEDERIRHKNKDYTQAFIILNLLRSKNYTDASINVYADERINKNPLDKVAYALKTLVRSIKQK